MTARELASIVADKINLCSLRYTASIPDDLYAYHGTACNLALSHKEHVVVIERRKSAICRMLRLPKLVKVFQSQLYEYAFVRSLTDDDFASRFLDCQFTADDIETMVREVTYNKIHLHLRDRHYHDEDMDDY